MRHFLKLYTLEIILFSLVCGFLLTAKSWRFDYPNKPSIIRKHFNSLSKAIVSMSSNDPATATFPSVSLVKKGKKAFLDNLRREMQIKGEEHSINKYINNKELPYGVEKPIGFFEANRNKFNTVTVLAEWNKKANTGFILGVPSPEVMGGVLRDSGAKGIVVSMDARQGGASPDEFLRFCREQARARLFLPGPLPIIWSDLVVDHIQIAHAASLGGSAITLYAELLDNLREAVLYCRKLSIEPIVMVRNLVECNEAINAGATCLCMHSLNEKDLISIRSQLPSQEERPDLMYIAKFRPEADFSSYYEIDLAWVLRDSGFQSVWPSPEALYSIGMSDIYPIICAFKAKASRQFLSPRQFLMDRKKEGATEYLGDILY